MISINNNSIINATFNYSLRSHATSLPYDVLTYIFGFLSAKEDQRSFGSACRRLRAVWLQNVHTLFYGSKKSDLLPSAAFKALKISESLGGFKNFMQNRLGQLSTLKELDFHIKSPEEVVDLNDLSQLIQLTSLILSGFPATIQANALIRAVPSLVHLDALELLQSIDLPPLLTNLQELRMCVKHSNTYIGQMALLTNLRVLRLDNDSDRWPSIPLANFIKLEKLIIDNIRSWHIAEIIEQLTHLIHLKKVNFSDVRVDGDEDDFVDGALLAWEKISSLNEFSIDSIHNKTSIFKYIFKNLDRYNDLQKTYIINSFLELILWVWHDRKSGSYPSVKKLAQILSCIDAKKICKKISQIFEFDHGSEASFLSLLKLAIFFQPNLTKLFLMILNSLDVNCLKYLLKKRISLDIPTHEGFYLHEYLLFQPYIWLPDLKAVFLLLKKNAAPFHLSSVNHKSFLDLCVDYFNSSPSSDKERYRVLILLGLKAKIPCQQGSLEVLLSSGDFEIFIAVIAYALKRHGRYAAVLKIWREGRFPRDLHRSENLNFLSPQLKDKVLEYCLKILTVVCDEISREDLLHYIKQFSAHPSFEKYKTPLLAVLEGTTLACADYWTPALCHPLMDLD